MLLSFALSVHSRFSTQLNTRDQVTFFLLSKREYPPRAPAMALIDMSLTCCNDQQYLSIFLIVCYAVIIFKLCVHVCLPCFLPLLGDVF